MLTGGSITSLDDQAACGQAILDLGPRAVLVKGGHRLDPDSVTDCLCERGKDPVFLPNRKVETQNNHGTGCTLSSAIASNLAKGHTMAEAVKLAKEYISGALGAMLDLGKGSGPMDHGYMISCGK